MTKATKTEKTATAVTEKKCGKCGETKPASEFWKNSSSSDGLQSTCKDCQMTWGDTPEQKAEYFRKKAEKLAGKTEKKAPAKKEATKKPATKKMAKPGARKECHGCTFSSPQASGDECVSEAALKDETDHEACPHREQSKTVPEKKAKKAKGAKKE